MHDDSNKNLTQSEYDEKRLNKFFVKNSRAQVFYLGGLFFILFFCILYFTRTIVLPFVFALIFNFLLSPLINYFRKYRIPAPITAIIIILVFISIIGIVCFALIEPAATWMAKGQEVISALNKKFVEIKQIFIKPEYISPVSNQNLNETNTITTKTTELIGQIFFTTGNVLVEICITIFLLYFLLTSNDFFFHRIINWISRKNIHEVIVVFTKVRYGIWRYLFARTMINLGLAVATAILMYFMNMPNPLLWGVMVGVLEYIPYVGAFISLIIILMVAIFSFANLLYAFFVAFLLLIILTIEANFVTPIVIGKTVTLQPVIVFLSLMFWGLLWGVPGIFLAIPITVIIKIIAETYYRHSFLKELLA